VTSWWESVTDYPNQGEEAHETCKELKEVSVSQMLFHMGSFDLLDICWECSTTGHKKSQRFLQDV